MASAFWPALAGVVVVGALIPSGQRALRIGALLYALVLIGSFFVPSAVGGNADRLGALATGPIAAAALLDGDRRRRLALLALVAPLVYWQVNAPITDFVSTLGNPATEASYYAPLLAELKRLGVGYGRRAARIEVVPTVDHWEARYVAPAVMIARGWERQLDRHRNGLFYGSTPLTAWRYRDWLREQGIDFVALPDASLDYSGKAEARLLEDPANSSRQPAGFLRQIWRSPHWRLFAVRRPRPLAQGFPEDLAPAGVDKFLHIGRASFSLRSPDARPVRRAGALLPLLGGDERSRLRRRSRRRLDGGTREAARHARASRSTSRSRESSPAANAAAEHRLGLGAMVARALRLQERVLPHGWLDALRQVSLFGLAYLGYRVVRGIVEGNANEAFAHARDLISLERGMHLFVEPSIQAWASGSHLVMVVSSWVYVNAQTSVTVARARLPLPAPQQATSTSCATCS